MTASGVSSPLAPAPLLHSKSYSSTPVQQFTTLRPPISTTPTRDGRSRSAVTVNHSTTITHSNFNDVMNQRYFPPLLQTTEIQKYESTELRDRVNDPLHSDHLARLNRIRISLSQHVSTLKNYSKQLSDLDTRQQSLIKDLKDAKQMLDKDATEKLNSVMPEITGQTQTMENVEERVETARTKLAQQVDMLADIDFQIAENRRLMALPPPSSRHIISAPPLHSRETSAESLSSEVSQTQSAESPPPSGWNCAIS